MRHFLTVRALFPLIAALALYLAPLPARAYSLVSLGAFNGPVDIRTAAGQPSFLYVVEKSGRIVILENEVALAMPFLDITGIVLENHVEQGLLSLAFPPDYATSRRFYVLFVNNNGNVEIDEFLRSAVNERVAVRSSRRVLLVIPHPDSNIHNGGQLHFRADGTLYISVGDGGGPDTGETSRRLDSLLGKILRINPLPGGGMPYQIPPTNPFVGIPGRDEIFAYGLRNPWRFAFFQNLMTISDVGASAREEVNIRTIQFTRGKNFGWPQYEGNVLHNPGKPAPNPQFPIFVYNHNSGRCAIIGGYVVTDPGLPLLNGRYLYGDLCTGQIRSFAFDAAAQTASGDASLGLTVPSLRSFGRGRGGQIYVAGNSQVFRLEP